MYMLFPRNWTLACHSLSCHTLVSLCACDVEGLRRRRPRTQKFLTLRMEVKSRPHVTPFQSEGKTLGFVTHPTCDRALHE